MTMVRYGISRNMIVEDQHGKAVKVAMVRIVHENGIEQEPFVIREDAIAFHGEGYIDQQVVLKTL